MATQLNQNKTCNILFIHFLEQASTSIAKALFTMEKNKT